MARKVSRKKLHPPVRAVLKRLDAQDRADARTRLRLPEGPEAKCLRAPDGRLLMPYDAFESHRQLRQLLEAKDADLARAYDLTQDPATYAEGNQLSQETLDCWPAFAEEARRIQGRERKRQGLNQVKQRRWPQLAETKKAEIRAKAPKMIKQKGVNATARHFKIGRERLNGILGRPRR